MTEETTPAGGSTEPSTGWKPPASQEELDRIISSRLSREQAKFADYDTLKEKATQYEALAAASQTDQERAVNEAKATTAQAERSRWVPQVVTAEFKAAAAGVLTPEQVTAFLEDVDLSKYVKKDGSVDTERIASRVQALTPATQGQKQAPRDFGQGAGGSHIVPSGRDAGKAEFERRFGHLNPPK